MQGFARFCRTQNWSGRPWLFSCPTPLTSCVNIQTNIIAINKSHLYDSNFNSKSSASLTLSNDASLQTFASSEMKIEDPVNNIFFSFQRIIWPVCGITSCRHTPAGPRLALLASSQFWPERFSISRRRKMKKKTRRVLFVAIRRSRTTWDASALTVEVRRRI